MSGKPIPSPIKVAWSGDAAQLACRLNMSEPVLTAQLKRLAQDKSSSRLVVEAIPANAGPTIAALARLLNAGATP